MYHLTLNSEDELLAEMNAAATSANKCRTFVQEHQHILYSQSQPENYFPVEFVKNLGYWQKMFEENEDFDPRPVADYHVMLPREETPPALQYKSA